MNKQRNILVRTHAILAASTIFMVIIISGVVTGSQIPTIGPEVTGVKAPDADGFIQRWLILDPIRSNGLTQNIVQEVVKSEASANLLKVMPHDGDKATVGGEELTWHAVDTDEYNVNLYYFASQLNKATSNVMFWAVTIVNCQEEMSGVRLAIGSNAASVWWVNGKEVIGIYGDRQTVIDDGVSKRLKLMKGPNVIRCLIVNAGGATDFCARILDSEGKPLKDYTVSLSETAR